MEKTISGLNKKAWYRLLKVVYILSLVAVLFFAIISIWFEMNIFEKVVIDENVKIVCKKGNKETFNAKEYEVYLNIEDIKHKGIGYFNADKIVNLCKIENDFKNNCSKESNKDGIEGEWERNFGGCEKSVAFEVARKIRDENEKKIKVDISDNIVRNEYYELIFTTNTKNKGGFFVFLGYSILAVLGIILVFEIIKRTFYYIVLGSINPEK